MNPDAAGGIIAILLLLGAFMLGWSIGVEREPSPDRARTVIMCADGCAKRGMKFAHAWPVCSCVEATP